MTDVTDIKIDPIGNPTSLRIFINHAIFWGYLVFAETASHLLIGGSWVIDIMILVSLSLFVAGVISKSVGAMVTMSPDEIRRWVDSGMPRDIKSWRETQK
jgi:hypothetical protein